MRKTIWGAVALFMILSAGAGFFVGRQLSLHGSGFDRAQMSEVPDWLVEDLRKELDESVRNLVVPAQITVVPIGIRKIDASIKPSSATEDTPDAPDLLAAVKLPEGLGATILYERRNGDYEAVFSKQESVYSYQVVGEDYLVLTTDISAVQGDERALYVIHKTPEGYHEAWSGIAHRRNQQETMDVLDATVKLDPEGKTMVYFSLERTLDQTGVALMEKSSYQLLRYNERTHRFEK
ncbi:hypothetical protein NSQ24_15290 [Brevibacillus sp. FSL L8-0520]|jgi:hypothetical protein|uniref:hypothetical protein n=1 Tax=Brevibacillus TaxID=55080 RepID=UPI001FA9FE53|nr:hypothetical protein [Brevibacillus borstelensis]